MLCKSSNYNVTQSFNQLQDNFDFVPGKKSGYFLNDFLSSFFQLSY